MAASLSPVFFGDASVLPKPEIETSIRGEQRSSKLDRPQRESDYFPYGYCSHFSEF